MTDLERQLTTALEKLSAQFETEQRRHSEHIEALQRQVEALQRQVERLSAQVNGLDRILRHLWRGARQQVEMTRRQVELTRPRRPDRDSWTQPVIVDRARHTEDFRLDRVSTTLARRLEALEQLAHADALLHVPEAFDGLRHTRVASGQQQGIRSAHL